ncbi:Enhancer of polycomb-like [Quillaja saponaria]|uniref:Enhancer of polycomb-like protein n=1 Tax=Quillaja saponaria TaxID=32244 RepID=A0AAD7LXT8_QUISA|nr:Enhancer of polycomb-like [Quillaja saponaria]
MENRVENSHGTEIPKKSRSLDLKSLYKSKVTKDTQNEKLKKKHDSPKGSVKRKNGSLKGSDEKSHKKKKSRKEVSLSSLQNVNGNSKVVGEECHGGSSSGWQDSHEWKLGLSQKSNGNGGCNIGSLSLDGDVIRIPKRKRGFVRRKKFEDGQALNGATQSSIKGDLVDQIPKLGKDDLDTRSEPAEVKLKKDFDDFKENRGSEQNSILHFKEKDDLASDSVVNNGDLSLKKSGRNHRKRKVLVPDGCRGKKADPLLDNSKVCNDAQEYDDENLEENAARMLSSRFDPSCTGLNSSSKPPADGLSFSLTSSPNVGSHASKSLTRSRSASVDAADRVLRPRRQRKEKGNSRKRRHFYEMCIGDMDAYWVLNRKIKVFWPLDQSWYYGLVNDYDKERKLHHVKYDDRDEEWINLENERFKLLLLPSEGPGRAERKKSVMKNRSSDHQKRNMKPRKERQRRGLSIEDDRCVGNNMDSEPIISWLARSSHRVKSSPSNGNKKQKSSGPSLGLAPALSSDEAVNVHGYLANGYLRRGNSNSCIDSLLQENLADAARGAKPSSQYTICTKNNKPPIVYFRRRFCKSGPESPHTSDKNHLTRRAHGSVSFFVPVAARVAVLEDDVSQGRMEADGPLWSTQMATEQLTSRFEISFPIYSVLKNSFEYENLWLVHAVILHHCGTVMAKWPRVQLEMLFVDNVVGLRLLLFEGSLKKAIAFVFLILTVFREAVDQVKYVDVQLPVTSIRFKFSCYQYFRKQLVFAFYNFSRLKNSKWMYLDHKLKRYCLLSKQLPLPECTYDNILALQNGSNELPVTSIAAESSLSKVMQKRFRQRINIMGVYRESTHGSTSQYTNSDKMYRKLPPFGLSFAAAPTFFLSLHLKLLMEHSVAHISFHDNVEVEDLENPSCLITDDSSSVDDCSNRDSEVIVENNLMASSKHAGCDGWLSCARQELLRNPIVCDGRALPQDFQNVGLNGAEPSAGSHCSEKVGNSQLQKWKTNQSELEPRTLPSPLVNRGKADNGSLSLLDGISVEIPSAHQIEKPVNSEFNGAQQSTDMCWNMNGGFIPSPNPTAPRSTCHRNRTSSSSFGFPSHGWSDGKADFLLNGFSNGPKKPRTQVSYSLPFGDFDYSSRHRSHHQKGLPNRRIRRANDKKSLDACRVSEKNLESLSCDANVLVTLGDRGWRECGAQIALELFDHNEWKLAVKLSGITKYSYKAHQFLQPGSTNRYTHAMMWKGGKDWILEFPDRSQWGLFKEMHEECYNRNFRAASVKNIPIPGVRLIEENDENRPEIPFVRSSKYFRQIETDVERALDPSRVLYDMDTDDEQWIMSIHDSGETENYCLGEISKEMFEKTIDMFEKAAYAQQHDQFTSDEIEELMDDIGPLHVVKTIYEHWHKKRQKKGMALIRHFQPPLWEKYQQQVKEWELAMTKNCTSIPNGYLDKTAAVEKPPMFAFCLKPRGLEVPNRGSKQRSHKKFSLSAHTILGDQDGYHCFGRRLNGFTFGDEKVAYPGHNYDSLDDSPLPHMSPRIFSPQDAGSMGYFSLSNDGFDRNHIPKLHRSKSKKLGSFMSPSDAHVVASYNQRTLGKRNGTRRWNLDYYDWPSQRHYQLDGPQRHGIEQLVGSDLDEFRLRDASGAAQHALNMAKLKREKAQRLLYRADLAIHKAVVALMTAEAMKASSEDSNLDGYNMT